MTEEVLKQITEAEKEADEIIFTANEKAWNILKEMESKGKTDGEKVILDAKNVLDQLKSKTVSETEDSVSSFLTDENDKVKGILNIEEDKIDNVVSILKERIVK